MATFRRATALIFAATLVCTLLGATSSVQAQTMDPTTDATDLVDAILGASGAITVTDAEFTGATGSAGIFVDGPMGMDDGIAISSGLVTDMPFMPVWTVSSTEFGTPGHPLCDQLTAPYPSMDAAVLSITFDIASDADGIEFDYIVGSDEYPDWVGEEFNDGFGVFLNGENVALDQDGNDININGPFFSGDTVVEWPDTESNFQGSTPRLSSQAYVTPGSTGNQLDIVICDAADEELDTGAFISSFDACFGDCEGTAVCGDGLVQTGEQCDLDDFDPEYAECPEGFEGEPMCNNHPDNPEGDGSCTVSEVPYGCEMIDYCADPTMNDCHENAICTPFVGGYDCECMEGYYGDGVECFAEVIITEPGDGDVVDDSTPTVTGTGEPGETVTVYVDGEEVGTAEVDEDGNWQWEPDEPLDDGEVTVTVDDGESSDEVTFTIDTSDDLIIVQPTDGSVVNTSTPTVSGTSEPGAEIDIIIDGEVVDTVTADEDGNWQWQPDEPMDDGEVTVTARTETASGHTEDSVTFEIDTSTTDVVIETPEDGALLSDSRPTVSGTAAPGAEVTIYVDGEEKGTVTADENGQWEWEPDEDMEDGEHTVEVVADDDGDVSEDSVTFTIDTTPPPVFVDHPSENETVSPDDVVVSGTSEPGATIDVYIDGEHVGTTTADEDGNWELPVGDLDEDEEYELEVTATDEAGNSSSTGHDFFTESDDLEGYLSGGGPACATTQTGPTGILYLLALFGLFVVGRRRRSHR